MSAPGSGKPASRKRPLAPCSASSSAASCGGDGGVEAAGRRSGSPTAKRRLFAADGGGDLPGLPGRRDKAEGKVMSDDDHNPEELPSAYNNAMVHSHLREYTSIAREVHGPEYYPNTQDIDGELVVSLGGGKKHGRYWIGDNRLDTATTPTLSQPQARSKSLSPAIHPRLDTAQSQIAALQNQLEEERMMWEAQLIEERRLWEARLAEQIRLRWAELEEDRRLREQMFQWCQSLSERMGLPPPPMLFPPTTTSNRSEASTNGSHAPDLSRWCEL